MVCCVPAAHQHPFPPPPALSPSLLSRATRATHRPPTARDSGAPPQTQSPRALLRGLGRSLPCLPMPPDTSPHLGRSLPFPTPRRLPDMHQSSSSSSAEWHEAAGPRERRQAHGRGSRPTGEADGLLLLTETGETYPTGDLPHGRPPHASVQETSSATTSTGTHTGPTQTSISSPEI